MFVLFIESLSAIPKNMIFVNNINEEIALIEYLCTKFLDNLKDKIDQMIQYFHFNLSNKLRKLFVKDFFSDKYIYIDL